MKRCTDVETEPQLSDLTRSALHWGGDVKGNFSAAYRPSEIVAFRPIRSSVVLSPG